MSNQNEAADTEDGPKVKRIRLRAARMFRVDGKRRHFDAGEVVELEEMEAMSYVAIGVADECDADERKSRGRTPYHRPAKGEAEKADGKGKGK